MHVNSKVSSFYNLNTCENSYNSTVKNIFPSEFSLCLLLFIQYIRPIYSNGHLILLLGCSDAFYVLFLSSLFFNILSFPFEKYVKKTNRNNP